MLKSTLFSTSTPIDFIITLRPVKQNSSSSQIKIRLLYLFCSSVYLSANSFIFVGTYTLFEVLGCIWFKRSLSMIVLLNWGILSSFYSNAFFRLFGVNSFSWIFSVQKVKKNTEPFLYSDAKSINPSKFSTIILLIISPRPIPLVFIFF